MSVAAATGVGVGVHNPTHAAAATSRGAHLDPGLPTAGTHGVHVVISARTGAITAARRSTTHLGGRLGAELPIINGFAAVVPADRLRALSGDRSVLAVTADRSAHLDDLTFDPRRTASSFVPSTGADQAWSRGDYGAGVGVAVVDTGVSDVDDLAGRVIHGPDLSGDGTSVDAYGHGTVMAGLIAGDGTDSTGPSRSYTGVAPRANIIAVKVAGRNASVDVSTMLQALHWVAAYHDQFNIRVLNLSWGVASTQDPSVDPIDYAVERLWNLGIVVVVAAGNAGPMPGTITKPGDDPLALTVGALDDHGNPSLADDSLPLWSSRGPTARGLTKPDVVAPGRKLVATRSFGSYIEQTFPKARIGSSYIRGSGTSEATAVVSGLAALLIAQRSSLTPDQVKYLLKSTAVPVGGASPNDDGAGRVQLGAALVADESAAPVQVSTATGTGSIEASRGGLHVTTTCGGRPTVVIGEVDAHCEPWDGTSWAGTAWTGTTWTGVTWTSQAWTPAAWTGTTWTGGLWTGDSWLGAAPWTGTTWTGTTWTGTTWTGTTWTGTTWTGTTWTGTTWTTLDGLPVSDEFQTAFWGNGPYARSLPGEVTEWPNLSGVGGWWTGSIW
ncbi:MAG: S8 family peptidase [Actinomycetes bacterium]